MHITSKTATIEAKDTNVIIAAVAYGRTQIAIESHLLPDFQNVAAVRIKGMLFVAAPHGDEILDKEWKTGRVYGS